MKNIVKNETSTSEKVPFMKRTIINKIRPRIMHPRYTDDGTLRFIVTKTYVEEGQQMHIIEDDFLHFAIRAGEIWMEPQDRFELKKARKNAKKAPARKTAAKKAKSVKAAAKKK